MRTRGLCMLGSLVFLTVGPLASCSGSEDGAGSNAAPGAGGSVGGGGTGAGASGASAGGKNGSSGAGGMAGKGGAAAGGHGPGGGGMGGSKAASGSGGAAGSAGMGGPGAGGSPVAAGGMVGAGGTAISTGGGGSGTAGGSTGGSTGCEPFGHYGPPQSTFTLPVAGTEHIDYPDIQKSLPSVDWAKLDRLYIPAGVYKSLQIGNLPTRDVGPPLVITNLGGQVQIGPNDAGGNYIWSMGGGSHWVLTGRYDPDSGTGDAAFPGHRCGEYAASRGRYGFLSDDAFAQGQYLHMGMAVASATDFEIEFVEVTRSGFAGIRLLNSRAAGDPPMTMSNVSVHDTYVHDTASEGYYFGWTGAPPSNLFPGLSIYNNRIVRTGSETLQIQDLGDGAHVHHNAFAFAALHWLDNFGDYQDNGTQVLTREGTIELDHNVIMGGAGTLLSFFSSPEPGDGARHVTFHDNYFADTRNLGGYLNGSSDSGSSFDFVHNVFRGLVFSYDGRDPTNTDPGVVFGINSAHKAPIFFDGNTWEGPRKLTAGIAINGTQGNVTATGNENGPVTEIAYVASGYPGATTQALTIWGAVATLVPGMPPISYATGDLVMYDAVMYRALKASKNLVPPEHPEAWEALPLPIDDLRVAPGSPYQAQGLGIH